MPMEIAEIASYVLGWWHDRKTLDNPDGPTWDAEVTILDNGNTVVTAKHPCGVCHTAITVYPKGKGIKFPFKEDMYSCFQWNQYHYTGILPAKDLTRKKLYSMMLKQRRIMEHSTQI